MADAHPCDLCGRVMPSHTAYIVRVEVYADPSTPPITAAELDRDDHAQTMEALLAEMAGMPVEDIQDQVHRRFEYRICPRCHPGFLANPMGRPRGAADVQAGQN